MDEMCFEVNYIDEKIMDPIIATMMDYEVIESSPTRPSSRRHFHPKINEYYQNDSLPLTFKKSLKILNSHSTKDDEQSLSLISRKNNIKYT